MFERVDEELLAHVLAIGRIAYDVMPKQLGASGVSIRTIEVTPHVSCADVPVREPVCSFGRTLNQSTSSLEPQSYLAPPYVHAILSDLNGDPTYVQ